MKKYIFVFMIIFGGLVIFSACTNSLTISAEITEYSQELVFDNDTKTLYGKQVVNYFNQSNDTLNSLKFHLYPNAFRENAKASVVSLANTQKAYPNGKSYGKITINSVSHANSDACYQITGEDENILNVDLPTSLLPKSRVKIEIDFVVTLPNINHRFGYGNNTINFGNYYPIACVYENNDFVTDLYNSNGDPFYSQCSNYNVNLTLDDTLTVASTGEQEMLSTSDGKKTIRINAKRVRDFAFVISDKFNCISETFDGINLNYYYYKDTRPDESFDVIKKILTFNKDFSTAYPYSTYSVAESNFVHGGMEYPNLVLISDDLSDFDTYINVIIHETCHQWWYSLVGNNEYNCGWFDEGLTDYNTAIFYDAYPEYKLTSSTIMSNAEKSYSRFVKVYSGIYENLDTSMTRRLDEYATEYEYVYCTYTKGMLMFNSLKDVLGEKKFNSAIKDLCKKYMYSEIDREKFISTFEKSTHKSLNSIISSYLDGKVKIIAS